MTRWRKHVTEDIKTDRESVATCEKHIQEDAEE
jgi:hypothetical protein